ncbi:MAG TPA: hypothetical protein VF323_02375, partial [Candidatus Limnocylindrales bacterium]
MESSGQTAPVEHRFRAWQTRVGWLRARAWLVFLVVGLGLGFGGVLVGDEDALQPLMTGMGLGATLAILTGMRAHRPARRLPWQALGVSMAMTTIGGVCIAAPGWLGVFGQAMTGVGAVFGLVGFIVLVRGRIPGGDRAALLDAAILASGIGVLIWAFG